jgi:hypothetical protein
MVVSGVPTRTKTHAENVANFSLDMVVEAGKVQSPATGKSIQVNTGLLHSLIPYKIEKNHKNITYNSNNIYYG